MSHAGSQIRQKHLQDVNLLHKESPYGNFYTPVIKSRIVGGKLVHVREDDPVYRSSPRDLVGRHPLSPQSRSRANAAADAVEARRLETVKLLREDQQERVDGPPHSGSDNYYNGYQQQQHQQQNPALLNPYQPLPPIGNGGGGGRWAPVAMETAAGLLNGLYGRLPRYTDRIASSQVQLSRDEELAVMRELHSQLRYVEAGALKRVYTELADTDEELTGLCVFEQLQGALVRNNIYLSNPLVRVVASAFISPYDPPRVNYEKVLSFIGASIQLGVSGSADHGQHDSSYYQPQQQQQPMAAANGHPSGYLGGGGGSGAGTARSYYHPEEQLAFDPHRRSTPPQSPPPQSPQHQQHHQSLSSDRDLPRVLRQLESEVAGILAAPGGPPPLGSFESLRQAFQRADRQHRGTLSAEQMKRLVWDFRLPLSQQVLDSAVALCRHRGGGQFDWEQFVALLERVVAPQSTGLRIPESRRPADYARHLPEPSASWPHAEPSTVTAAAAAGAQTAAAMPLYRTPSPPPQQQQQLQYPYSNRSGGAAGQLPAEPWFNRFMKLASALYRRDSEARGFVSESQVKHLVDSCNEEFQLGLSQDAVRTALEASRLGGGVGVNINELLKRLSVKPVGA